MKTAKFIWSSGVENVMTRLLGSFTVKSVTAVKCYTVLYLFYIFINFG